MAAGKRNPRTWIENPPRPRALLETPGESENAKNKKTKEYEGSGEDRNHRRQRPLHHGRAHANARSARENALRRSFRRDRNRHARRPPRGLSRAARARAPLQPQRYQLSRQYLRHEDARRRAHPLRQRGGIFARRSPAARFRDPGPVLRPHAPARGHVLRRRSGGARGIRQANLRASGGACRGSLRSRGHKSASHRNIRVHGRAAVFDPGGIAHLPPVAF